MLVIGLICTALATLALHQAVAARDRERFEHGAAQASAAVVGRLDTYIAMLRAGAGLYAASERVSRSEFHDFVERLELPRMYPGVQGIGFTARSPDGTVGSLEALGRAEWSPVLSGYHVWPAEPERSEYHAILFLEPLDERNRTAIGYDMFSEPVRREAMERARDTGLPAMSQRVRLIQETDDQVQPGFLVYVPVYRSGPAPATVTERREALVGFIYSPFRATDLFSHALAHPTNHPRTGVTVYDGTERHPEHLLYADQGRDRARPGLTLTETITVAGRDWTIDYHTLPGFEVASGRDLVLPVFALGLAISTVLALIAWREARARSMADRAREEARAAGAQLRQTLDTAAVGLVRAGRDLRYIAANPAYGQIAGVKVQDIIGHHIAEVMGEEALAIIRPYIDRVLAGERVEYETDLPWARAGTKRLNVVYTPWREDDGSVSGWVASITDVTDRAAAEHALRESEARFRSFFDSLDQGFCVIEVFHTPEGRPDYRFTQVNKVFEQQTGLINAVGRSMRELAPGHEEQWFEVYHRIAATGTPERFINEARALNRWYDVYAARVGGEGSRTVAILFRDITQQRRAQASDQLILALEDQTRALVDPVEVTNTAARILGQHLHANRCAYADVEEDQDTFNLTGDYNDGVPSIVGRYAFAQFGDECLRVMRANQPFVVQDSEADPRCEDVRESYRATNIRSVICVPLHKAGRFAAAMAVHATTPRAWRQDEVELVQTVAARCWESIERARVTRDLRAGEERYRAFIANSSEGIWRLEIDPPLDTTLPLERQLEHVYAHARFAECNDVMARMYGLPGPEALIGQSLEMMLPSSDPGARAYITRVLLSGYRLVDTESQERDAHGRTVFFSNSMVGVSDPADPGKLLRVWGTQRDITSRRAAEDELAHYRTRLEVMVQERTLQLEAAAKRLRDSERLASLGTLTAGLGHDLHNALLPLRIHVEELSQAARQHPDVRENADAIASIVGYLSSLSRGMRMISMDASQEGESGETNLCHWKLDAARVLQSSVGRGIEVTCTVDPDCPRVLIAPHRLTQAVFNIVQNARAAILHSRSEVSGGRIDITATLRPADADAGNPRWVELAITDNGGGMTEEVRRRCMEPFFTTRARAAGRGGGGTGMGLSIVAGTINAAGGRVEAESTLGEGSTFRLLLPAAPDTNAESPPARPTARVELKDPRASAYVTALLSSSGWQVQPSGNGHAASDDARLLIADARSATPEDVAAFTDEDPHRTAVVLDVPPGRNYPSRPNILTRPAGEPVSALRSVLAGISRRSG